MITVTMWNFIGVVLFIAFVLAPSLKADFLDVSLEQGVVRGSLSADEQSYRFLGLPYATAPLGADRFKAPLEPPNWSGTLNANNFDITCLQPTSAGGTEDCLVVNVYVPVGVQHNASVPVLAMNHGGAFVFGSGNLETYEINRLMAQEIILVSYNYRLGALGFLCLGTVNVPGNAGLKDQVAALRWIKRNIAKFGGDSENITVFGISAGSVSLEILALSKATEGLFNKVILESGSALSSWAVAYDPVGTAKSAAEIMGFPNVENLNMLEEIFINATPEELILSTLQLLNNLTDTTVGFSPCIETILDDSTVLSDSPMNIIISKSYHPVPIMIIYSNMEGIFRMPQWEAGWDTTFEENFAELFPPDLSFENNEEKLVVAESVKQFYIDNTENHLRAYVDFMTDIMFAYSTVQTSVLHAENDVPVYLMEFSFYDEFNPLPGATHADFWGHVFNARQHGPANDLVAERGTLMIGNFMKHNNPIPSTSNMLPGSWPTVTSGVINYLAFNDHLTIRQSPFAERYQLWQSIYETNYKELPLPGNDIDTLDISLEQGIVRGYLSKDRQSFRFFGIPYADAPAGRDRFKASRPPSSWTGILHATDSNIRCLQPNEDPLPPPSGIRSNYGGTTDDCLVVNVYIPAGLAINASVPVLAITHGGGFVYGSGNEDLLEINRLMGEEIVLVSYNYRLGVLGFLCLGTETVPGNAGLKDQVAALRWIKNNIASFGGDPNDVTVFGYSAGSVSVELLALSDATEGLLSKIILESGSALGSWAVDYDPIGTAKSAADFMGFPNVDNLKTLEEIFINATPEELASAALHLLATTVDMSGRLIPCLEKILDNSTVLSEAPMNIIRSSDYNSVPIMAIYSDMEGSTMLEAWEAGWNAIFKENFADFMPPNLSFENDEQKAEVAKEIKTFYTGNTENELLAFVDFITDIIFAYSIIYSSVLHSENSVPMYLMEFSFHDEYSLLPGATHIDFFGHIFNARLQGTANDLVAERATQIIVNFIKYDDPIPSLSDLLPVTWPTVTPAAVNYLAFNDQLTVQQSPIAERYQLWRSIYETHYKELPLPNPNSGLAVRTDDGFTSFLIILCIVLLNLIDI